MSEYIFTISNVWYIVVCFYVTDLCLFISAWRTFFSISWKVGLVVVNFLAFVCLGKPLFLLHICRITLLNKVFLSGNSFLSTIWVCHSTLSWTVGFAGKSADRLMEILRLHFIFPWLLLDFFLYSWFLTVSL